MGDVDIKPQPGLFLSVTLLKLRVTASRAFLTVRAYSWHIFLYYLVGMNVNFSYFTFLVLRY